MSAVWFTSDLHLGHRLVADLRGFETVGQHDATLIGTWVQQVAPDDVVWVLGDLAVSNPTVALAYLADMPGRKRLVVGNHDKIHPMYRDAHKWVSRYGEVFEWVTQSARVKVCGREVLLSHFPYERDREDVVRYRQWRLRDDGMPLLHGHTHGTERLSFTLKGRVEVHVGLDAWGLRLVSDAEVADLL